MEKHTKHFDFINSGTIIQIVPLSVRAAKWMKQNLSYENWQVSGGAVCVEPRAFNDIEEAIKSEFN